MLRNKSLKNLPKDIDLTQLYKLDLYGNYGIEITPEEFKKLVNLQYLSLEICRLTSLPFTSVNLQKLYIGYNRFTEVPKEVCNLINLQVLGLQGNDLVTLPKELENLVNLRKLYLESNKFIELPKVVCSFTNLQELGLKCNDLTYLPNEIGNLENLQKLDLTYNNIVELPKEFSKLVNLQILELVSNNTFNFSSLFSPSKFYNLLFRNLSKMPNISMLINLQELHYQGNKLRVLPKEFCNLINLRRLSLNCNSLTVLPEEIGNLVKLEILYLNNNNLTSIPITIGNLVRLTELTLSCNYLTELPNEIGNLIELTYLVLHNNYLTSLPASIGNLRRLINLTYYGNPITLPPNIVNMLNRIKTVQNIYNDRQSVHNHNIQECVRKSIYNILNGTKIDIGIMVAEINNDNILTRNTKNLLHEYCRSDDIHPTLEITFQDLLQYIWPRITKHKESTNIKQILNIEMNDSYGKCFTGRLSRLVNCLVSFYDDVSINISDSEQIGNIIFLVKNNMEEYDVLEHKRIVRIRLEELAYEESVIEEWLEHIA